jgi:hypothetical protein
VVDRFAEDQRGFASVAGGYAWQRNSPRLERCACAIAQTANVFGGE